MYLSLLSGITVWKLEPVNQVLDTMSVTGMSRWRGKWMCVYLGNSHRHIYFTCPSKNSESIITHTVNLDSVPIKCTTPGYKLWNVHDWKKKYTVNLNTLI